MGERESMRASSWTVSTLIFAFCRLPFANVFTVIQMSTATPNGGGAVART